MTLVEQPSNRSCNRNFFSTKLQSERDAPQDYYAVSLHYLSARLEALQMRRFQPVFEKQQWMVVFQSSYWA